MPELTAPLVMKNDEKRIVSGPVLIPDEPDTDDDVVTEEQIENVAHQFVEDYGNIDLMHSLNNVGKMVESYILPMDMPVDDELTVPKGSWMLSVRVTDDESWQAVKDNKLGGFSIMGIQKQAVKSAEKGNAAEKRTTLSDLGDDFIVNAVSLVDDPAVPKAKFLAIKSKAKKDNQEEITQETVQKAIAGSLEERESLVRRKVYSEFDTEQTESFVHSTFDSYVIVKIIDFFFEREKKFQFDYEIDEQGNVTLSNPQEVRIEENIVPVNDDSNNDINNTISSNSSGDGDGLMAKIKKKLGFNQSEKAGRSISDANFEKLQTAKEVIDDLVNAGTSERSNKSKEGDDDMKQEEVQELVEKQMKPINDKLSDLTETLKSLGGSNQESSSKEKDDGTQEGSQEENNGESTEENASEKEKDDSAEESNEEETVSKSDYEKVVEELEKAKKSRPLSRRLAGQDNMAEKEKDNSPDRNAFGFKV
ncbi:XkdF-like putative serine protease domain-containing protein [Virgibacillus sp. CBA3643]|uniref:XkdF-like putative serine protease domain-containing protein n=1 Tax=Virgibacillus sp. CBA3643 TaxID=2942278 RepID=UPI0035A2DE13